VTITQLIDCVTIHIFSFPLSIIDFCNILLSSWENIEDLTIISVIGDWFIVHKADFNASVSHLIVGLSEVAIVFNTPQGGTLCSVLEKTAIRFEIKLIMMMILFFSNKDLKNVFGDTVKIQKIEKGTGGAIIEGAIYAGAHTSTLSPSHSLLHIIPYLYNFANLSLPTVFHVQGNQF
jgi:hypothetical protein